MSRQTIYFSLTVLAVLVGGCASQSTEHPAPLTIAKASVPTSVKDPEPTGAKAAAEFDQLRTLFTEQCNFRIADTLVKQVRCAHDRFRLTSPVTPSLRLYDQVADRFLSDLSSKSDYAKRLEFAELVGRVQHALESGATTVDAPLDEVMEGASLMGARHFAPRLSGSGNELVPLARNDGGTFTVSASINGKLTLDFILDTGASDVSIPADVALTLMRTGTLQAQDFVGRQVLVLADGSKLPSPSVRLHSIRVGTIEVNDVTASIVPSGADLLLGQTFLGRLKSWTLDNNRPALIISR